MKKRGFFILFFIVSITIILYFLSNKEEDKIEIQRKNDSFILINIDGAINAKGDILIKKGSTYQDLFDMYGLKNDADISSFNLNERLENDIYIMVPYHQEKEAILDDNLININTASKEELMSLYGIGDYLSDKIIEYRNLHLFQSIEELMNVSGIKEKVFENIKDKITCQ